MMKQTRGLIAGALIGLTVSVALAAGVYNYFPPPGMTYTPSTGLVVGSATGGAQGAGTINMEGCYVNGTACTVGASPTGANPTASVGLSAVNGSATTFMRSDAAPPLDQGISPMWTGTHTFVNYPQIEDSAGGGPFNAGYLGTPVNVQTGNYTLALSDRGKLIQASGTLTITVSCNSIFKTGDVISIAAGGSSTVTVSPSDGTLYWANGTTTTGSRTLTGISMDTIYFGGPTAGATSAYCFLSGSGIS